MKKCLPVMLCALFALSACMLKTPKKPHLGSKNVVKMRKLASFSEVVVDGDFELKLVQMKYYDVSLKGYQQDIEAIDTSVFDNTLKIALKKGASLHGKPTLTVSLPVLTRLVATGNSRIRAKGLSSQVVNLNISTDKSFLMQGRIGLRQLAVNGKGKVNIRGIKTKHLSVIMQGKPTVTLRGEAALRHLDYSGEGHLSLYWVDSLKLDVVGRDKATVTLAGIVDTLHMALFDYAEMDSKNLRINTAYVKTHDEAVAKISVIKHQHTLAANHSNIYFYLQPEFGVNHMAGNGASLLLERGEGA